MSCAPSRDATPRPSASCGKSCAASRPVTAFTAATSPARPTSPFPGRKKVIFVHGCFWHGHDCKRGARLPKTNADYWRAKIARNRARDETHRAAYAQMGFDMLTIWECETRDEAALAERLRAFIGAAHGLLSRERTSSATDRRHGDGKARTTVPSAARKPPSGPA